jgi:hypothetical protein
MPFDRTLIRERLGRLGVGACRENEIIRELGDHVADHAAALEAQGHTRHEAESAALDAGNDWRALHAAILAVEREGDDMNYRTKAIWLPACCTVVLSVGLLNLVQAAGVHPGFYSLEGGLRMPLFVPWLLVLPLAGAIGAFLSKQGGGRLLHRILVALSPVMAHQGIMAIVLILVGLFGRDAPHLHLAWLAPYGATWVLLPSLALLIGTTPFLRNHLTT